MSSSIDDPIRPPRMRVGNIIRQTQQWWSDWRQFRSTRRRLHETGFFDREFYLRVYPDVKRAGHDPLSHYLRSGADEGRNPNSRFDTTLYQQHFPECVSSGINPLVHYVQQNPTAKRCEYPLRNPKALHLDIEQVRAAFDMSSICELQAFFASQQKLIFPQFERPEVSILLALFNRCELTYQCLQSLLVSCRTPFEVVVVDNACSDNTQQLLQKCDNVKVIRNRLNEGFVRAMNQAAEIASGKYLLMLNNDTQLLGNPVDNALELLRSDSSIGVVGGRIILPDGTLQEAGCILRSNGSASGYGRGSEPGHYEYMFRRDVDFCSGAFFLTPRSYFESVGGLDERFSPAYCEEVDYCIQLAKQGKRIVYEPNATIMHYEFASSTSRSAAVELQKTNTRQLYEKHREWFDARRQRSALPQLFTRTSRDAMRVLMIDDRVPFQSDGAGAPRARAVLQSMHCAGSFVTLLPTAPSDDVWGEVHREIPPEIEVASGVGRELLTSFLRQRNGYYDMVFVSRPHNMQLIVDAMNEDHNILGNATLVYDAEAVFALREISRRKLCGEKATDEKQQRLLDVERSLTASADLIVTVSAFEAKQLQASDEKTITLPHTIDLTPTPNGFQQRSGVLFVGALSEITSPNADSLQWFTSEVLPELRQLENPLPPVRVCGKCPPAFSQELATSGLEMLGRVEDLQPVYNAARVFIAPTRFAAGIPLKILEAAAHGVPVVATSILARQLDWQDGIELLVADSPADFAREIYRLHQDEQLWQDLRAAALKAARRDCCKTRFDETIAAILAFRKSAS